MKNKRGISLIVLIITIIVVIILAAAIILTLSKNNVFTNAKEARFKEDIRAFQDELEMYKASRIRSDESVVNISADNNTDPSTQDIITSMNDDYASKLTIENGKLVYTLNNKKDYENEYQYAINIGIADPNEPLDEEIFEELKPFITKWHVEAGDTITLPLNIYANNKYDFTIDYGDGTGTKNVKSITDENAEHSYKESGTYTVTIKGSCPSFDFSSVSTSRDKITEIVQWGNVFKNYDNSKTLGQVVRFLNCTNLQGSIPDTTKNTFSNVYSIEKLFSGCTNLHSQIPENLFYSCPQLTNFRWIFSDSGVTGAIPENLFKKSSNAVTFEGAFSNCKGLTGSIPENLFKSCNKALYFDATFLNCTGLTGDIPEKLFFYCPEVSRIYLTFDRCSGLDGNISEKMFDNNQKVTAFNYAFRACSNLKGTAPKLWERDNGVTYYLCFSGCTQLSNYADIPAGWK